MKFILVTDCPIVLGPDNKWYSQFDYAIEYLLNAIPEISEFVMWGRCCRQEKVKGYYEFPEQVNSCKIRIAGPLLKKRSRAAWPKLVLTQFFRLKQEVVSSDIVMLRMPSFFPIMAYHCVRKNQKLILHVVGNASETLPIMVPHFAWLAPLIGRYCKIIGKKADLSCFVSKALRDIYGQDSNNTIISNDCRYSRKSIVNNRDYRPHQPPRVVYLGRLSAEKGLVILFRAIAILKEKMDIRLNIIGIGPIKEELGNLAKQLNISDIIKWYGYVDCGQPLFDALSESDTFVLPSFSEGLPSVIPEAMTQGLLIVATHVGGIPEVLRAGQAGLLVPPHDINSLAEALEISLTDMELRKKLVQKSLECAEFNCIENQTGRVIDKIGELIRN